MMSVEVLQAMASVQRPGAMAQGIAQLPQRYITPHTAAWMQSSQDMGLLVDSLASSFQSQEVNAKEQWPS